MNQYHADHGGGRDTTLVSKEDLDSGVDEAHIREEGDYVGGDLGGKDNMDIIAAEGLTGSTLQSKEPLELNEDTLVLRAGITLHLGYPMVLHRGCEVQVDTVTGSGIVIKGNNNSIWGTFQRCEGDGVRIDGGQGNGLSGAFVDNKGTGVDIRNGAKGNAIYGTFRGNKVGVHIQDWGTEANEVGGRINKSTDEGVIISRGARFNTISAGVDSSGADGVLITGRRTDENKITGDLIANKGNGVHITDGAQANEAHGRANRNGKNGVLIEGRGTDNNGIEMAQIVQNAEAGIKVVGSSGGSPFGTIIDVDRLTDNRGAGIWLSGVTADVFRSAAIIRTMGIRGSPVGIRLDKGTQDVRIEPGRGSSTTIDSCQVGVLISGENTAFNTVGADPSPPEFREKFSIQHFSQAGVHIIDGAYSNILKHLSIARGEGVGFLLDKGAHHNQVRNIGVGGVTGDGMVIDGASENFFTQVGPRNNTSNGLVIRNGARDNVFKGPISSEDNAQNGIVIQGVGTEGNRFEGAITPPLQARGIIKPVEINIEDTGGVGILITDGATDTRISGALITRGPEGIRVTGGAQGVEIYGCQVRSDRGRGIVVDGGAKNIRIGRPGDPAKLGLLEEGENVISLNGVGILVQGAETEDVRIVYNLIEWNQGHGVIVQDGAKKVVIGGQAGALNAIFANTEAGIYASGAETEVTILGNTIGMIKDIPRPNREGIVLEGGIHNVKVLRNYIATNEVHGVRIDNGAHHNTLLGNTITENKGQGVVIDNGSHHNSFQGNDVFKNSADGILVAGGSLYNTLRGNTITGNVFKGIRLTGGGNNGIPAPVIDEFSVEGQRIQGYVEESVPRGSTVDVFGDMWDEGSVYIGSYLLTSNRFYLKGEVPPGMFLHALVTDPDGNTSEFGPYEPGLAAQIRPSTIVFTSTRDGNPEIYLLRPGSGSPERLTDHSASDYSPRLSPDGERILFVSERSGNPDLWLMETDGSNPMPLTDDPAADYDPAWSPDGTGAAFVSERGGNPDIYALDAAASGELSYDDGEADWKVPLDLNRSDILGVHFTAPEGILSQIRFYIFDNPAEFQWTVREWGDGKPGDTVIAEGTTTPEDTGWHTVDVGNIQVPSDSSSASAISMTTASPAWGWTSASR